MPYGDNNFFFTNDNCIFFYKLLSTRYFFFQNVDANKSKFKRIVSKLLTIAYLL